MSYEVLLLGLLVGAANYCFRYLPLRLRVGNARPTKRGAVGILLDTIGIASMLARHLKKPKLHWLPAFAKPTS